MRPTLRNTLAFVMLCGLAGCGDDPKPEDTGNTQTDDKEDSGAGDDSDTTTETDDNDTTTETDDSDSSESTTDQTTSDETDEADDADDADTSGDDTDDVDLPDPVLPDVEPETPLSELDEDELAQVCAAYLETAVSITNNLSGICPTQAVVTASQSMPEDDAAAQEACVAAETMCTTQVEASKTAIAGADCDDAGSCGATVADFNACNRQIAALNEVVIIPVGEMDAPACESMTRAEGTAFSIFAAITVGTAMQNASEVGGGSPTDEDGPCQRLQEQCPEFGAALDAFEGLQLPAL